MKNKHRSIRHVKKKIWEHLTPLDWIDLKEKTPLLIAIYRSPISIVERLLNVVYPNGTAVNINHRDAKENTPLHICLILNFPKSISYIWIDSLNFTELLCANGANYLHSITMDYVQQQLFRNINERYHASIFSPLIKSNTVLISQTQRTTTVREGWRI